MISFQKPGKEFLDRWLEEQKQRDLSYPEVCGTREGLPTIGYSIDRYAVQLGQGEEIYRRAVAAIRTLRMWDLGWLELCRSTAPVQEGSILATLTCQLGIWFLNPCRVVYMMDEREPCRRAGLAYGTLEGHVECGEERFMVEWRKDDSVWYEILAFSHPAHWLMQWGYLYSRRVQRRFGADSLQAMVRAVEEGSAEDRAE